MTPLAKTPAVNARLSILGNWTMAENGECYARWVAAGQPGTFAEWRAADPESPKGIEPAEKTEAELAEFEDRLTQDLDGHLAHIGMPEAAQKVLSQGVAERSMVIAVRAWWKTGVKFALLFGDSGLGKTIAACVPFLYAKGAQCWSSGQCGFIAADELARLSYFGKESDDLVRWVSRVRLLVLDDLGAEMQNPAWLATLDRIVMNRDGRTNCRTLITTNLSARKVGNDPSPFEARYGGRVVRRIRESGKIIEAKNV